MPPNQIKGKPKTFATVSSGTAAVLRDIAEYRELGSDYFDRLHPERTAQRRMRRLN
ncbi:MAG: hypothetical protein JOY54_12685 [Acidobacteriaceae bacterium]|nr:hypothetical protein [Acidobacteriaceae bacterium]